jgi:hypothetical protein
LKRKEAATMETSYNCGNALRQRLKPGTKRDNKNGGRHSISCSERGSERMSVEEVEFI